LGWAVVWVRTQEAIQLMIDDAPKAKWYYSDGFDAYQWLWYHFGRYEVSQGKSKPIQWKAITLNCVIIWHVWLANRVVSHAALMRWSAPCACLCIVSTADNFTNNVIQIIRLTYWTSLAHYFSHSLAEIFNTIVSFVVTTEH
jgi:hypothetical protein